ncbi:MAG: hypothetical protein CME71_06830 [Halobacteriovorax sp.]|nr:hypothetical protein [Halobacteriovorax sp.]
MKVVDIRRILAIFLFFVVMFIYFLSLTLLGNDNVATMLSIFSFCGVVLFGRKYYILRKEK